MPVSLVSDKVGAFSKVVLVIPLFARMVMLFVASTVLTAVNEPVTDLIETSAPVM